MNKRSENPRNIMARALVTEEEIKILEERAMALRVSKSDILRVGIFLTLDILRTECLKNNKFDFKETSHSIISQQKPLDRDTIAE